MKALLALFVIMVQAFPPNICPTSHAASIVSVASKLLAVAWAEIDAEVEGDTFFPTFDRSQWRLVTSVPHAADERHAYAFNMNRYERA